MSDSAFILRLAAAVCVVVLVACSSDTTVNSPSDDLKDQSISGKPGGGGGGGSTPNPAIVYMNTQMGNNTSTYKYFIKVMDADGQNQTSLLETTISTQHGNETGATMPCWSNTGSQISFKALTDVSGTGALKKFTVGTDRRGKPIAEDLTTIYSWSVSDSITVGWYKWSPAAAEIIYTCGESNQSISSADRTSSIMVVSASGGTPSELYSTASEWFGNLAVSSDGDHIAITTRNKSTGLHSIIIVERSTGDVVNTLTLDEGYTIASWGMDWASTGANTLAFIMKTTENGTHHLYTVDAFATSFAPELQVDMTGVYYPHSPSWDPDNSKIAFGTDASATNSGIRTVTLSSGALANLVTNTSSNYASSPNWKP